MADDSLTHDGITVTSNYQTADEMRAELGEPKAELTETASKPAAQAETGRPSDRRTREGRKASLQAEIDEHTARREEAKREADDAQRRRDAILAETRDLEARRAAPRREPERPTNGNGNGHKPKADDDPEPQFEDFAAKVGEGGDAYTPWLQAHTRWTARDEFRKQQQEHAARETLTAHERDVESKITSLVDRIAKSVDLEPTKGREIYEALVVKGVRADVFLNPDIKPLSALRPGERGDFRHALADVVLQSDRPVEMMLELSKDEHYRRLSTLPPDAFYQAIGEIKQGLAVASNGPIAKPVRLSAASPPTKPLGSSPVAATKEPPGDDASDADYEAYWAPIRKKARSGR